MVHIHIQHVVTVFVAHLSGVCAYTPEYPAQASFSASLALHPLKLTEIEGTAWPYFSKMSYRFDAGSLTMELQARYKTFAYISPAYEYLESRTVCRRRDCSTMNRNSTGCSPGVLVNVQALLVLYSEMPSKGSYVGPGSVEGTDCDIWQVQEAAVGNLTVCVGSDGVPRSMLAEPSVVYQGRSNVYSYSQNLSFEDIVVNANDSDAIDAIHCPPPQEPKACAGHGVSSQQILRFSDGEPWGELQDRDVCDWTGVGVTGGAPGYWSFFAKKYLEIFDVELNTSFAPARDCNWDPVQKKAICVPEYPDDLISRVSRSSAEGLQETLDDTTGQCRENDVVGSWLVFPHQGQCKDGQDVGDDGCTWKVTGFKVVEVNDCFKSAALFKAWDLDWQNAPFPRVMDYMQERVAACPDVSSPNLVYP